MPSFAIASPGAIAAAFQNLTDIGSAVRAANTVAAGSTTSVATAAADEVSTAIAALFGGYARDYEVLGAQLSQFHDEFARTLGSGGLMYAGAEATNAGPLQPLLDLINAPTNAAFGRPLIGDGADGPLGRLVVRAESCSATAAEAVRGRRDRPARQAAARACSAMAERAVPAAPE